MFEDSCLLMIRLSLWEDTAKAEVQTIALYSSSRRGWAGIQPKAHEWLATMLVKIRYYSVPIGDNFRKCSVRRAMVSNVMWKRIEYNEWEATRFARDVYDIIKCGVIERFNQVAKYYQDMRVEFLTSRFCFRLLLWGLSVSSFVGRSAFGMTSISTHLYFPSGNKLSDQHKEQIRR